MRTLRSRLFVAILAASLVAVGVALAIGIALTRSAVRDSLRTQTLREAQVVAQRLASDPAAARAGASAGAGQRPGAPPQGLRPVPPDRQASPRPGDGPGQGPPPRGDGPVPRVVRIDDAATILPTSSAARVTGGKTATGELTFAGRHRYFAAVPIDATQLFVLATRPTGIGSGEYGNYLAGLLIAAAIAAVLAAFAAALIARRLVRPLQQVAGAAQTLAAGGEPAPLPAENTAEVDALATSFNNMAAQLAQAREAERTVLMSVSHELRTPLTAIRGYAEAIEDNQIDPPAAAAVIASESGRLERLVQDLLALARIDQGVLEARHEAVDLNAIGAEACRRLAPRAAAENIDLRHDAANGAAATGDGDRTLQIVSNLVDNAIRVTPGGGTVTVATAPGTIVVSDTGPGIPEAELPYAFERFHLRRRRGLDSADGSGIGLAIVRELTAAMGGTVAVENLPGAGARFTVTLPR